MIKNFVSTVPLGRVGKPTECATAIAVLASDAAVLARIAMAMRHISLLFAGRALARPEYIDLWRKLSADSTVDEVLRNFFIRQPVLWLE